MSEDNEITLKKRFKRLQPKHTHKWVLAKYHPAEYISYMGTTGKASNPVSIWICICGGRKQVEHD